MKFNLFLSLVLLLGCTSCIEEINFQQPPDAPSQIVVYGKISNNPSPHDLRILETIPYGDDRREREVEGATVFIEDDLGNREQYLETGGGNYQLLQATVKGTPGRTYSLDILLPGGKRLRSLPETMPPVLPIDSQYWQLDSIRFFHTFINAKIPPAPAEGGVWLRWETDHVWARAEAPIGLIINNPFYPPPKLCFIRTHLRRQIPYLFESLEAQGFDLQLQSVGDKKLDHTFWERSCMETVQLRMTRRSYNYWNDADKAANPGGNIFDSPPATVRGNLFNPDAPDELALGFFEAVAADTARVFISRNEFLPVQLLEPCIQNYQFNSYQNFGFPPECVDCLRIENSTLQKPWFW